MTTEPMVYMVVGWTGEYSDRTDWPVRAYLSEENAVRHRDAASVWAKEFFRVLGNGYYNRLAKAAMRTCPHDKDFTMTYTGTDYEIWEAPLGDGEPT